jgi:hypothetical protein
MDGFHKIGYGFHGMGDGFHLHSTLFHPIPWSFHGHSIPHSMVIPPPIPWSFHPHSTLIPWLFHLYSTPIPWLFHGTFHMESMDYIPWNEDLGTEVHYNYQVKNLIIDSLKE